MRQGPGEGRGLEPGCGRINELCPFPRLQEPGTSWGGAQQPEHKAYKRTAGGSSGSAWSPVHNVRQVPLVFLAPGSRAPGELLGAVLFVAHHYLEEVF